MKHLRFLPVALLALSGLLPVAAQPKIVIPPRHFQLPAGLSLETIRARPLKTANLEGVESFRYNGPRFVQLKPLKTIVSPAPKFDTSLFLNNVDATLKGHVAGYAMAIQRGAIGIGKPKLLLKYSDARHPTDGTLAWDGDTRMHLASVSKVITAMGVAKALHDKGLDYDTKISPYLPAYWIKGPNVDKITFHQLLTQSSGFVSGTSNSDYGFMRDKVAAGVTTSGPNAIGTYHYENMNCGLCRVLLPILLGDIAKTQTFSVVTSAEDKDKLWDAVTLTYYRLWIQNKVLTPSGVEEAGFNSAPGSALAYSFPANSSGWDSGDVSSWAGGAGWHLSVRELLDVMSTWADTDKILPRTETHKCLDMGLGLDVVADTPVGRMYSKNGLWQNGERREQCVAYFLPNNLQFVVFVNSGVDADNKFLRSIVDTAFLGAIKG